MEKEIIYAPEGKIFRFEGDFIRLVDADENICEAGITYSRTAYADEAQMEMEIV